MKAEERRRATQNNNSAKAEVQNFAEQEKGITRNQVAKQAGFGSGEQYRKAKYIADNADQETIDKLNNEKISIHKAYKEVKKQLKQKYLF